MPTPAPILISLPSDDGDDACSSGLSGGDDPGGFDVAVGVMLAERIEVERATDDVTLANSPMDVSIMADPNGQSGPGPEQISASDCPRGRQAQLSFSHGMTRAPPFGFTVHDLHLARIPLLAALVHVVPDLQKEGQAADCQLLSVHEPRCHVTVVGPV